MNTSVTSKWIHTNCLPTKYLYTITITSMKWLSQWFHVIWHVAPWMYEMKMSKIWKYGVHLMKPFRFCKQHLAIMMQIAWWHFAFEVHNSIIKALLWKVMRKSCCSKLLCTSTCKSAVQSKNTVCASIKHNRYFH